MTVNYTILLHLSETDDGDEAVFIVQDGERITTGEVSPALVDLVLSMILQDIS